MNISLEGKKVLFITTKNLEYLRNTQEIELISEQAKKLDIIGSNENSYIKRLLKVNWKILTTKFKKYDCVFVGFSPQLIVPVWFWKFRKTILIEDFFISVYDTMAFDRKKFKPNSIMGKFCKHIDRRTIKKADHIICDTNQHGNYFSDEFGVDRSKIETLYLKADENIYHPMHIVRNEEIKDKFIVLYFGSVLPLQGIDIILEAIDKIKDNKDIYFNIIGPIKEDIYKPEGSNIRYYNWLSQVELAQKIAESDLCLAGHFNKNINKALRTIPGKAYIYEAMDKPMILGDNMATRELYNETMKNIFFVEMGDSDRLAKKIIECKNKLQER